MPISEARKRANQAYIDKQDEIKVRVPKGAKACIKVHADEHDGGSVNGFINRAIIETMGAGHGKGRSRRARQWRIIGIMSNCKPRFDGV